MIRLRIVCSSSKMAFGFILAIALVIFGGYWTAKYLMLPSEVTNTTETTSTTASSDVSFDVTSPVTLQPTGNISSVSSSVTTTAIALDAFGENTARSSLIPTSPNATSPLQFYDY